MSARDASTPDEPARASSVGDVRHLLRRHAAPLAGQKDRWNGVLERIGGARVVLLGAATHGTHEFCRARSQLTARLVEERGFVGVALEADWPDVYRVNRFVRGEGPDRDAEQALLDLRRFPTWVWRNEDVLGFVRWLRVRNERRPASRRAGVYGLDLFSLQASAEAVLAYLERVDPPAARRARDRYGCLDRGLRGDVGNTGEGAIAGTDRRDGCEAEVIAQLVELRRVAAERLDEVGLVESDAAFCAMQNARVVARAERYYRETFRDGADTWGLRGAHMAEMLAAVMDHLGPDAKVVVWAHASHLGDSRATDRAGERSLGALARDRFGDEVVSVGFTTHSGSVTAARAWGGDAHVFALPPAASDTWEGQLHDTGIGRFLLDPRADAALAEALAVRRPTRLIGVVHPQGADVAPHLHTALTGWFDLIVHLDVTRAVTPTDLRPPLPRHAPPEARPERP